MTGRSSITVDLIIDAPAEQTWAAVTDWPRQSDWVAATTVRNTAHDGVGVGGALEAVTGWGPFAVVDPMVIVEWDPPRRVVVEHQGKVRTRVRHFRGFCASRRPVALCLVRGAGAAVGAGRALDMARGPTTLRGRHPP